MSQPIRNGGSAPVYRAVERFVQDALKIAERTPKSGGLQVVSCKMVDLLTDMLTTIGLALNELDYETKYELLTAVFVQMRTVKSCVDILKEWSNHADHVRIIGNRQMPHLCEQLDSILSQLSKWRSSVAGKTSR